jgi:hypothetical protein
VELNVNIVGTISGENYRSTFKNHMPDKIPEDLSWYNQNEDILRALLSG